MFTQNYINLTRTRFTASGAGTQVQYTIFDGSTVNCNIEFAGYCDIGHSMKTAQCYALADPYESSIANVNYNPGVFFGRGDTPASLTDYALADPITSGLTIVNGGATFEYDEGGKHAYSASYTVRNNTGEDVTIKEIGVFCQQTRKASSSKYYFYNILMERTVLSNPITIPPGVTKLITYKITFNQSQ